MGSKHDGINLIFFRVTLSLIMYLYYIEKYLSFHLRQMSHTLHPDCQTSVAVSNNTSPRFNVIPKVLERELRVLTK